MAKSTSYRRCGARIHDVIRVGLASILALFATGGCGTPVPSASPLSPIFDLDSGTASCADDLVGVDAAIAHALAHPGYLDCITVTLQADPLDGTIWLCNPVRDPASPICDGTRMELRGLDIERIPATWHAASGASRSDPIQLLGRVRFL